MSKKTLKVVTRCCILASMMSSRHLQNLFLTLEKSKCAFGEVARQAREPVTGRDKSARDGAVGGI